MRGQIAGAFGQGQREQIGIGSQGYLSTFYMYALIASLNIQYQLCGAVWMTKRLVYFGMHIKNSERGIWYQPFDVVHSKVHPYMYCNPKSIETDELP